MHSKVTKICSNYLIRWLSRSFLRITSFLPVFLLGSITAILHLCGIFVLFGFGFVSGIRWKGGEKETGRKLVQLKKKKGQGEGLGTPFRSPGSGVRKPGRNVAILSSLLTARLILTHTLSFYCHFRICFNS